MSIQNLFLFEVWYALNKETKTNVISLISRIWMIKKLCSTQNKIPQKCLFAN